MAQASPFILAKQLESDVARLLSHIDITDLEAGEQRLIKELRHGLIDARLEIQDYELAETRELQLKNAQRTREYLAHVQNIISSNTISVFGAVDVAHLTARIGQITDKLR